MTPSHPSASGVVTDEYSRAVQSISYNEMWSKIQVHYHEGEGEGQEELVLDQVLQPNRHSVQHALRHADSNNLTRLVSDYFRHSEAATHLCLLLHRSVYRARELYAPLHQLVDVLEQDSSLNQSQCTHTVGIFLQFDRHDNPFPSPDTHSFDDTRRLFNDLKLRLDTRLRSSRSKIRRIRGATVCLIGTTVAAVVASAAAMTAHALTAAVVVGPWCGCGCGRVTKKEVARMKQVDAAAKGTCVVHYLATMEQLARRLHMEVEDDKLSIRWGLERGGEDKHPIQEVLKKLRKRHSNFLLLLDELDQHVCLCFNTINRARSLLLHEIYTFYNALPSYSNSNSNSNSNSVSPPCTSDLNHTSPNLQGNAN